MTMENEKIKDKIEKLLNLSMSNNEHEAKIALEKAMKLMQSNNITKEEVYKQDFISELTTVNFKRFPNWLVRLYGGMARVSGCKFTYTNGWGNTNAIARITGRRRDVENASYLVSFLQREVEQSTKKYKKEMKEYYFGSNLQTVVKSYKVGIIRSVIQRLEEQNNKFFNEQSKGKELICLDNETKVNESYEYLKSILDGKIVTSKSSARYSVEGLSDGIKDGNEISLSRAVSKQTETKLLYGT